MVESVNTNIKLRSNISIFDLFVLLAGFGKLLFFINFVKLIPKLVNLTIIA